MDAGHLRRLLVLANPFKEGDLLVGGTRDDRVRDEARRALGATTLGEIRQTSIVNDGVSEMLARTLDGRLKSTLDPLTVAQFAQLLLTPTAPAWIARHRAGLTSDAIAAVTKIMSNDELSIVARALFNPLPGPGAVTVGAPAHFGSRIQPNSPGDTDDEILLSICEGLAHGCGDVILGLNPASDELDTIVRLEELLHQVVARLELPTRYCVLSDLPKQQQALQRTAIDVGFQSLAGTSKALACMVGLDADGVLDLARSFDGLYFETGQGSAVTNGAAEGVDMVTLEARAYGLARAIQQRTGAWMIVNDVAGFIGPEVFRSPEQLERTCLEDTVMAKLHGLTMGLDVCATFHMGIAPTILRELTERIVERAAPAYLMAVAGNADPMLGYLTTSFREHPRLRERSRRHITSAMHHRLTALGVIGPRGDAAPETGSAAHLFAAFAKAGGDTRTASSLADDARLKQHQLRERGFDLGCSAQGSAARLETIYRHARLALYARLDDGVVRDAAPRHVRACTASVDRDDYLAHPPHGERLRDQDARAVTEIYAGRRAPQVQMVISDGLNANAINGQLRALLPAVRRLLTQSGADVGEIDVVIENGRVRAGYHVGQLVEAEAVVHFIGERPGTGLDTVSAYLTYGRDGAGHFRWSPDLDHSCTTAVCGIHPRGKPPGAAVEEIVRTVQRILETRRSGVAVSKH